MTQKKVLLDYTKPPTGYIIGPDTGDNEDGWFWIRGPQNGEGHRGDIGKTENEVLTAAWAHYKREHDPPGMRVDMGIGIWRFAWQVRCGNWSNIENAMWTLISARAAAWSYYDRRRALALRLIDEGQADTWPRALAWNDAECDACDSAFAEEGAHVARMCSTCEAEGRWNEWCPICGRGLRWQQWAQSGTIGIQWGVSRTRTCVAEDSRYMENVRR